MKAVVYVSNIKRVIPIYHVTKNRKLKGEVDSQSAYNRMQQELILKKRRKTAEENDGLSTYAYSMQAVETFYTEMPQFDHKA
jgi:hypothetical protein